ncbi:DUF1294 domain-containing protein [Pseudalkalibacillus decolorationis]|uniref:DUF1294 domain-containing protein n=1 Tax=Pseudalkalibacillus decolorationis TaxID=163879 RepID=UPI002148C30F|nr:DUF1294 domain-containing protein [Pseudalkalibacillus decolorationis]
MTIITALLAVLNIYGLALMYIDKQKAKKQKWRISEAHLWLVSIFGGAFGVLIGMYMYRHKTKHLSFRLGVPFIILVHISLYTCYILNVV